MNPFASFDWSQIAQTLNVSSIETERVGHADEIILRVRKGMEVAQAKLDKTSMMMAKDSVDHILRVLEDLAASVRNSDGFHVRREHPASGMMHLGLAFQSYQRLSHDADKRGDVAGADAWRIAMDAVAHAERIAEKSRVQQTWSLKP